LGRGALTLGIRRLPSRHRFSPSLTGAIIEIAADVAFNGMILKPTPYGYRSFTFTR
jgi:hypothetical protein